MSPKYDRSSQIFISRTPFNEGEDFLEIGSGTGIISLFAASNGASKIVAGDINPVAVENTSANFKLHNVKNAAALHSNLFSTIEGQFDTIFFNAPFHGNKPEDSLELGTSDHNYETIKRFFAEVKNFLKPDGRIIFGFSDMGDNDLIKELAERNDLVLQSFQEQNNGDWNAYLYIFKAR